MTTMRNKLMKLVFIAVLVTLVAPAPAYPPDNAAVLYYKAFMLYQPPDNIGPALWDYWKGNAESNEKIEEFIKKNRRVVDIVLDATRIDHCDWGLDYSKGTEILLPPHHRAREIFALLAAEATQHADSGDCRKALGRCISMYRMTRHLNEGPIICYLVGTAISAGTHKCLTRFLSEIPQDTEILTWLRDELTEFEKQPYSVKPGLDWKREAGIISMTPDRIGHVVESGLDDGTLKQKILQKVRVADKQFFDRNKQYWNNYMAEIITAFDLPYPQAQPRLARLDARPSEEFSKNPDATLTVALAPTWQRIHTLSVRLQTHTNAIKAAIEVYLMNARTGTLPDALPDGSPGDLYSGKPFQYEKIADGFILRCRGKDLEKDEPYEYEFKVAK